LLLFNIENDQGYRGHLRVEEAMYFAPVSKGQNGWSSRNTGDLRWMAA
jgi:putative heme iron utilization protein